MDPPLPWYLPSSLPSVSKLLLVPVLFPHFGLYCPYLIGPREGFKSSSLSLPLPLVHMIMLKHLVPNNAFTNASDSWWENSKNPSTGKITKKPALHHSSPLPLKLICSPQPSSPQKQEYSILSAATSSADTSITSVTINIIICCFIKPVNLSLACIPLTFPTPAFSPARNWQMHCYLCVHTYKLELWVPVNVQSP